MAYESWHTPEDLDLDVELHNEPNCGWVIDYFKKIRSDSEILLRISYKDKDGTEKAKDLGTVCFAQPNNVGIEVWYEVLRNKQIRKSILSMTTLEIDNLVAKGEGGLQDVAPDLSENYMLADGIRALRFKLLKEQKSKSCMWWFLEKCHKHEIDVKKMGKVPVSPESSKKKKSKKTSEAEKPKKTKKPVDTASEVEASKKTTLEAEKPKKTKKPVDTASEVEASKKTKSIQGTTASSSQTKGDTSTAHVPRTEAAPTNNPAGPSSPVIDTQPADCNSIKPAGVGEGDSVNMSTLDDADKDKNRKEVAVMVTTDSDEEDESSSKSRKRKAVAKIERPTGFQPGQTVVGLDHEAKGVKMYLDPNDKILLKTEFAELRRSFPLKDQLVYASITQLTDPEPTMVYQPCSIRPVAEIQNSMVAPGSSESPQPATVVPYEMYAGKKRCINILKLEDLKAIIKSGGKFMVISGLHSMKAAKNIILEVGQNKEHILYDRADRLKKRHIKIVRGDTPESVLCKLSFMANALNNTYKFETAFVEQVIHGRNQYKGLGSPPHAKKGMKNSKIYLEEGEVEQPQAEARHEEYLEEDPPFNYEELRASGTSQAEMTPAERNLAQGLYGNVGQDGDDGQDGEEGQDGDDGQDGGEGQDGDDGQDGGEGREEDGEDGEGRDGEGLEEDEASHYGEFGAPSSPKKDAEE
ncbi:hypothetical protein R1sor_003622 [Riccia sorocarpa]|uniref:Uncharacterized protein n=1 Tax=Riccia sorocarpa TaxID=122646 RepID=A0ABD3H5H9_9MARC